METDNSSAVSRKQIEGSSALTEDLSEGQGDQEEGSTTLLLLCVIFLQEICLRIKEMLDSNCIFNPHYSHVVMFPKSCNFAFIYIYVLF